MTTHPSHSHNISLKKIELTLLIDTENLQKLTGKNPVPAWIIGEKIAQALNRGDKKIQLNLAETLLLHQR